LAEYSSYLTNVVPFYGPLVQTILPLFLLMIALLRKKTKTRINQTNNRIGTKKE
jgi:hypothetical protein